jgi:lyso-ornithine lipid O-acyltransferase
VIYRIRAGVIFLCFMALTLPLIPVQWALLRVDPRAARRFPHWYHRQVCRLLGIKLNITGKVLRDCPVLVVSNHVSWLDIIVLSAVAPVSFVAKKEVASWPFVSILAKLQRTVFVDRERRISIGDTASEIVRRLAAGDAIVLFAEGTSSDGNRVLPFRTSLFAAAKPTQADPSTAAAMVQTVSIAYTKRHGLPLGWAGRRALGYYGDVSMAGNAWLVLTGGSIETVVHIGEPLLLATFKDRKELARRSEEAVRASLLLGLRN